MAIVLVLKCALDFKREVIVHLQHHVKHMIILLLAAPGVEYHREEDDVELSQVEAALGSEVWVDDGASEAETTEGPGPLSGAQEMKFCLITVVALVEAMVLLVPLDVLSKHLHQQVFVLIVLASDARCIGLTENVLADTTQIEKITWSLQHICLIVIILL